MTCELLANGRVTLHCGDMLEILKTLADNSIDSVVTDPPCHLSSIVQRFGAEDAVPAKGGVYARSSRGFMGKQWDGGDIAFRAETWREVLRVLKPGGHLCAFSGTRTYHDMAHAIALAGFEIRDMLAWLYGSGFPKSHDVSKAIDKALGAERKKVRFDAAEVRNPKATGNGRDGLEGATRPWIWQL
jgi:site-specific DNA-methyltransferase (adenine-specific)